MGKINTHGLVMKLIDIIRAKRQDQRCQAELKQAAARHRAYVKDETDRVEPGSTLRTQIKRDSFASLEKLLTDKRKVLQCNTQRVRA